MLEFIRQLREGTIAREDLKFLSGRLEQKLRYLEDQHAAEVVDEWLGLVAAGKVMPNLNLPLGDGCVVTDLRRFAGRQPIGIAGDALHKYRRRLEDTLHSVLDAAHGFRRIGKLWAAREGATVHGATVLPCVWSGAGRETRQRGFVLRDDVAAAALEVLAREGPGSVDEIVDRLWECLTPPADQFVPEDETGQGADERGFGAFGPAHHRAWTEYELDVGRDAELVICQFTGLAGSLRLSDVTPLERDSARVRLAILCDLGAGPDEHDEVEALPREYAAATLSHLRGQAKDHLAGFTRDRRLTKDEARRLIQAVAQTARHVYLQERRP
jgi:hypothetical protein